MKLIELIKKYNILLVVLCILLSKLSNDLLWISICYTLSIIFIIIKVIDYKIPKEYNFKEDFILACIMLVIILIHYQFYKK